MFSIRTDRSKNILHIAIRGVFDSAQAQNMLEKLRGEEFIIIFPESNVKQSELVLERIKNKLRQSVVHSQYLSSDEIVRITFSAGVASFPNKANDVNGLINAADRALYKSKNSGRNKIVIE